MRHPPRPVPEARQRTGRCADGKYRAGFADYLRGAFLGQGAATHLERALGVKIKDLDEEWSAYVRSQAGG